MKKLLVLLTFLVSLDVQGRQELYPKVLPDRIIFTDSTSVFFDCTSVMFLESEHAVQISWFFKSDFLRDLAPFSGSSAVIMNQRDNVSLIDCFYIQIDPNNLQQIDNRVFGIYTRYKREEILKFCGL